MRGNVTEKGSITLKPGGKQNTGEPKPFSRLYFLNKARDEVRKMDEGKQAGQSSYGRGK
jgi:hypothetical protein